MSFTSWSGNGLWYFFCCCRFFPSLPAEQEQFSTVAQHHLLTCSSLWITSFPCSSQWCSSFWLVRCFIRNTKTKLSSTGLPTGFQRRSSFYRKLLSASLSASVLRLSYLSHLAYWWRYSMELAGWPAVFPCSSSWQSGLELKPVLSFL